MSHEPDYSQALNIPKKFSIESPLYAAGCLLRYVARNPLPAMWVLGDPYLEYAQVETRNDANLLALGVAVYSSGHGKMEAFFHFDAHTVVWLDSFAAAKLRQHYF